MTELSDTLVSLKEALANAARLAARAGELIDQVPTPTKDPIPSGMNAVRIGGATFPLAGVNPTAASNPVGAGFPGLRGPDQLIAIQAPKLRSGCNEYGVEVPVANNTAGTKAMALAGGLDVPAGGYVLSGHGAAATFLTTVQPGMPVELLVAPVGPTGATGSTGPTGPVVTGKKVLGIYMMDGNGKVSQIPAQCNRILVAFYQGTDLVEWGGDTPATTATALKKWQAARPENQVVVSLGGQGGAVNLDQVDEGMGRINQRFPVSGIDFDAEAFSYTAAQALSIARLSAAAVGRTPGQFIVQFVPPGGNPVAPALAAAKACKDAGFNVTFGQQLYETSISDADVMSATQRAIDILGASSVLVGMMLGDSHNSWTVASAESRMKKVVAQWPGIGGAYLWESSRAGTADWAAKVGATLGLTG